MLQGGIEKHRDEYNNDDTSNCEAQQTSKVNTPLYAFV
jgi:hypothetical protein